MNKLLPVRLPGALSNYSSIDELDALYNIVKELKEIINNIYKAIADGTDISCYLLPLVTYMRALVDDPYGNRNYKNTIACIERCTNIFATKQRL